MATKGTRKLELVTYPLHSTLYILHLHDLIAEPPCDITFRAPHILVIMSQPALPPNSCLLAIILLIKTRAGPHKVFHYPPSPGTDRPHVKLDYENTSQDESGSSNDESEHSSLEDEKNLLRDGLKDGDANGQDIDESGSASPEKRVGITLKKTPASKNAFLGLPPGVHHLLCPQRTYHKKRFELTIDGLVFLGWPVFARKDGAWGRKKKKETDKKSKTEPESVEEGYQRESKEYDPSRRTSVQINQDLGETTEEETPEDFSITDSEILNAALGDVKIDVRASEDEDIESLTMFHVVFVMNPPALEYQIRVDEMYNHIVKKFSRALKWEQTRSRYILKEAEKLRAMEVKRGNAESVTIADQILNSTQNQPTR